MSSDGLTYDFGGDRDTVTYLVERHVSGDWKYTRQSVAFWLACRSCLLEGPF